MGWVAFEQGGDGATEGMGVTTLIGIGNVSPLGATFPALGAQESELVTHRIGIGSDAAIVARASDDVVGEVVGSAVEFLQAVGGPVASGEEIGSTGFFNVSSEDCPEDYWILGVGIASAAPIANFSGDPLTGWAPLSVSFTDESTNAPTSWHWEKNDGGGWVDFDGTPTDQNPTEDFAIGTWSVRLTATNGGGSDTKTRTDYVEATEEPAAPVADFSGTPLSGMPPLTVTFTDESTNTPTSWHWEKNDGGGWVDFEGTPTAQNPVEDFAVGTWSVRLTATNAGGSDTKTRTDYVVAEFISATGGTITTDGDYKVHTFTANGTFEVLSGSGDIEVLVVAGGGGGGNCAASSEGAGGGGGGGIVHDSAFSVSVGTYAVVVGAGGVGASTVGTSGADSSFAGLTAADGGGGGGSGSGSGNAGDGGGSGGGSAGTASGGTGTQGGDGAAGSVTASNKGGGGGGGDSANGSAGSGSAGGNGGAGTAFSISGSSVTYGSGGGGGSINGTAGSGGSGAGNGSNSGNGANGTANRGGGGGGAGNTT